MISFMHVQILRRGLSAELSMSMPLDLFVPPFGIDRRILVAAFVEFSGSSIGLSTNNRAALC